MFAWGVTDRLLKLSKLAKTRILVVVLGLILVVCLAQGEYLLLPHSLGVLGWVFYRIAFCVAIPPRVIAMLLAPAGCRSFLAAGPLGPAGCAYAALP